MKLKGYKIGNITYLVSDAQIAESGSLEKAAQKVKEQEDAKKQPKSETVKPKPVKKATETVKDENEETPV